MSAQSSGSKDQVARLLTLVPYLHSRGSVRLAEAAEALGVTPAQLVQDLRVLFMCGLPGGYPDDLIDVDLDALVGEEGELLADGVIRVSNADYLSRPLRLTPTEASAVIVALRVLRAGSEPATVEIVDRVLAKLETAAAAGSAALDAGGGSDRVALEPSTGETSSGAAAALVELRERLADAASRHRQVEIDYYVPTRDEQSHRVVDPRGVTDHDGFAYLDAWCHSAEAPRLFRLDRIGHAQVLDAAIVTAPAAPRDLADGLFDQADDLTTVTVRLAPQAHWITEYYPIRAVRRDESPTMEVDLLVADGRWLTRLLLRLAPHAEVVSPASYAEELTATAQQALALYS